ncbi:hypothetical protein Tco_1034571 [Tanacetum coccineum]
MTICLDKAILSGADNRPPMLEKDMYDSWKSRMDLFSDSVVKATNIISKDYHKGYALVSNHRIAKELWERIQLLMQGTSLTKQERASSNGQILHEEETKIAFLARSGNCRKVKPHDCHYSHVVIQAYDVGCIWTLIVMELNTANVIPSSEQSNVVNQSKTKITSDNNIIPYSQLIRLKQTLSKHLKEKESLMQTVTLLKNDFKKEEFRNIDREITLEKRIKHLDNIIFKRDQSAQSIHMLMKPQFFYDHTTKQAIGFQNPFYLKKAQ